MRMPICLVLNWTSWFRSPYRPMIAKNNATDVKISKEAAFHAMELSKP